MAERDPKEDLIDKVEFLKSFADHVVRDLEAGTVVSWMVLETLSETTAKIVYQAGRYNQVKLMESGRG